jgi:hypothetical protein
MKSQPLADKPEKLTIIVIVAMAQSFPFILT